MLKQLRYFQSVVRLGSFIEAARLASGGQPSLKICYLRSYTGSEFQRALGLFSEKHPDVPVSVAYGNHEELYAMMRSDEVDIILNDQRRAFSDNPAGA